MTLKTFRAAVTERSAPCVLRLDDGSVLHIPHLDFLAFPGPQGEETGENVAVFYDPQGGVRILDLDHVVSVDLAPRKRRKA